MGERDPLGLTPAAWEAFAVEAALPRYRGRQLFDAIHRRGVRDYAAMTELPGPLRERLSVEAPIRIPEVARREESADGSVKFGLRLGDGALIEAVFMPGGETYAEVNEFTDARAVMPEAVNAAVRRSTPPSERFTVCLSSQTGCAVDCAFCVTGRLGAGRNLTAGEKGLRIVFMGMGEPFLNPDGVLPALGILFEILPPRRVTVSTSGITPAFAQFAALPRRPNLAVSLNAADEATRTKLMPITATYPLSGLVAAMRAWPLEPRRRILVEYVLIAGVNDREEDARRLARLLGDLPVKVNVIPLNEDPTYLPGWKRPDEAAIDAAARRRARDGHGPPQQGPGRVGRVRTAQGEDGGPEEAAGVCER